MRCTDTHTKRAYDLVCSVSCVSLRALAKIKVIFFPFAIQWQCAAGTAESDSRRPRCRRRLPL